MSYPNPSILAITAPQGIDKVIESIRVDLSALAWLAKSFGRAWEFKEPDAENPTIIHKIPKVWQGKDVTTTTGEYLPVLPNDHLQSQSFIACKNAEVWTEYTRATGNPKERPLSIIFWFNLKLIDPTKDYIFTDVLKKDVEKILKANEHIKSINSFFDEKVEEVFEGYTINDALTQYLMYPYSGFRFDVTAAYWEEC